MREAVHEEQERSMSEFKIDAVGPYRERDGGRAEVKFIDMEADSSGGA